MMSMPVEYGNITIVNWHARMSLGRKTGYCGDGLLSFLNPKMIISDHNVDYKDSAYAEYKKFLEKSQGKLYSIGSDNVIIDYDKNTNKYVKI